MCYRYRDISTILYSGFLILLPVISSNACSLPVLHSNFRRYNKKKLLFSKEHFLITLYCLYCPLLYGIFNLNKCIDIFDGYELRIGIKLICGILKISASTLLRRQQDRENRCIINSHFNRIKLQRIKIIIRLESLIFHIHHLFW
jgi:hypothetical protein